ncbi:MAG TPA: hypothetical protein VFI31_09705 [Pirellulales bacterium]|nr:hypothetical protein [Pirellulales bacterium]
MRVIPLSEAKANLRRYGHLCHDEPVVVTVNGIPSFQLAPIEEDEAIADRLIEHNPKFRELLEQRLSERNVTVKSALRRL